MSHAVGMIEMGSGAQPIGDPWYLINPLRDTGGVLFNEGTMGSIGDVISWDTGIGEPYWTVSYFPSGAGYPYDNNKEDLWTYWSDIPASPTTDALSLIIKIGEPPGAIYWNHGMFGFAPYRGSYIYFIWDDQYPWLEFGITTRPNGALTRWTIATDEVDIGPLNGGDLMSATFDPVTNTGKLWKNTTEIPPTEVFITDNAFNLDSPEGETLCFPYDNFPTKCAMFVGTLTETDIEYYAAQWA